MSAVQQHILHTVKVAEAITELSAITGPSITQFGAILPLLYLLEYSLTLY